jgi:hypothetical protein
MGIQAGTASGRNAPNARGVGDWLTRGRLVSVTVNSITPTSGNKPGGISFKALAIVRLNATLKTSEISDRAASNTSAPAQLNRMTLPSNSNEPLRKLTSA